MRRGSPEESPPEGPEGAPPGVPGNATLVFEVELLAVS
jgi:FKBP-type peptidyl-prolyl cis-trans isomerase